MIKQNTTTFVILALLTTIEILFAFTPLGSIPITPGIVATLAHIPPIIAAILLGKKEGLYMGFVFGVLSLIYWCTMGIGYPAAFAFTPLAPNGNYFSLVICIVPRILYPFLTALIYDTTIKITKNKVSLSSSISAGIGTILHSFFVFFLLWLFFKNHPAVGHKFLNIIIAWGGVNAILEIIVAIIIAGALIPALKMVKK